MPAATKQRSKYRSLELDDPITVDRIRTALVTAGSRNVTCWYRNVGDGILRVIVDEQPMGWHLAITHAKRGKGGTLVPGRWAKYDEVMHARIELLPDHIDTVLHLPREEDYDAAADTTLDVGAAIAESVDTFRVAAAAQAEAERAAIEDQLRRFRFV